jgi:hypothetical protein
VGDWVVFPPWTNSAGGIKDSRILSYNPITDTFQYSEPLSYVDAAFTGSTNIGNWVVFSPCDTGYFINAYNPIDNILLESTVDETEWAGYAWVYSEGITAVGNVAVTAPYFNGDIIQYEIIEV